jgi:tetratricopeptide (TPR) repeat protein
MTGDIDEAERLATAAFELGDRTGQPDAFTWYAGQLWVISRERGQIAAIADTVVAEVERNPGLPAWQIVLAATKCTAGDLAAAQAVLDRLAPEGRLAVPRDVMWLYAAANLLEIAEAVGDTTKAGALYDALLPYRDLPTHGGVTYQGSTERYLAAGARALGRYDDAVEHLTAAIGFEERLSAPTWLGVACADLARTLRMRGSADDHSRADSYDARARELAAQTGSVFVQRRADGHYA